MSVEPLPLSARAIYGSREPTFVLSAASGEGGGVLVVRKSSSAPDLDARACRTGRAAGSEAK